MAALKQLTSPGRFALALTVVIGTAVLATTGAVHAQACTAENAAVCDRPALVALGDDLYGQNRYGEAVGIFRKAMALEDSTKGGDPLDLATVLVRLGAAMFHNTHNTAAEPILVRALAIRMEILGDHADTAEVLDLMSLVRFANAGAVSAEGLQGDAARMRARLRE